MDAEAQARASRDPVLLDRPVAPTPDDVRAARRAVAVALMRHGASDDLVADAELVASELLTNAMEQRPGAAIGMVLRRSGDEVNLCVTNRRTGTTIPASASWSDPVDDSRVRGRGLGIIEALSVRVDVESGSDHTSVTCWWAFPG